MSRVGLWWLAAALLLANLAYLFWPRPVPVPAKLPSGVKQLELIASTAAVPESSPARSEDELIPADREKQESEEGEEIAAGEEVPLEIVQCWELGPLAATDIEQLRTLFTSAELVPQWRDKSIPADSEFRVYANRPEDPEARKFQQEQLLEMGVESYVIGGGELNGKLSLGLYSSPDRTQAFVDRLAGEGFSAEIYERERTTTETWLGINSPQAAQLGWPADLSALPLQTQPGILQVDCAALQ